MREFKVGDKVSFEYRDGHRIEGIVFHDNNAAVYPLLVKPLDCTVIGWGDDAYLHYTRDGRFYVDVEPELILLTEPEAQKQTTMKVGDRILLELELTKIMSNAEYPLLFRCVSEDNSLSNVAISFTDSMLYHKGHISPAKYTLIERGFRAGDRVKCPLYGEGTISAVKDVGTFPVEVDFDNGKDSMYTKDGRWRVDLNPTLERLEEGV